VYATSAATPWLPAVYGCAPAEAAIVLTAPDAADLLLRLGEPRGLTGPAFQIGLDDVLVVTQPQVGVGQLSPTQVEALFAGQFVNWRDVGGADLAVQVWTFADTVDVQSFFNRAILHDRPVSSMARLAVSAQDMSDSVGSIPGSIGVLPRRWKTENTHEAQMVASLPVLALPGEAPQGGLAELIACLQARQ
jgi:hypothetical protein